MFIADSGCMSHMVNNINNIRNIRDVKTVLKTGNKKIITGLLREDWKGTRKENVKFAC